MSITQCPECGGTLSDTVTSCIHCGCRISTCPECGKRFAGDSKCPECGYEIKAQEEVKTCANEAPKKEVFKLSSEELDNTLNEWKKTHDPQPPFLIFAFSLSFVLTIFGTIMLTFYFFSGSLNQLLLTPVLWLGMAFLIISFGFSITASILHDRIVKKVEQSLIAFCENAGTTLEDLIRGSVKRLAENTQSLDNVLVDERSKDNFHTAFIIWNNSIAAGPLEKAPLFVMPSVLLQNALALAFLLPELFLGDSSYSGMVCLMLLASYSIYFTLLSAPKRIIQMANKRFLIFFPETKEFKGKYRKISPYLP